MLITSYNSSLLIRPYHQRSDSSCLYDNTSNLFPSRERHVLLSLFFLYYKRCGLVRGGLMYPFSTQLNFHDKDLIRTMQIKIFIVMKNSFMCMFYSSLFVLLYFFFWPLCCLSFFDIRILITPFVSSNSSYTILNRDFHLCVDINCKQSYIWNFNMRFSNLIC